MDGHAPGDSIGVVEPWKVPDPFDDVKPGHLLRVQQLVEAGQFRADPQAKEWAGHVVARVLDLDVGSKADKARIRQLLAGWLKEGALAVEERPDKKRDMRKWIVVGKHLQHTTAALEKGAARQGAAEEPTECRTTTLPPIGEGWCGSAAEKNNQVRQTRGAAGTDDLDDGGDVIGWNDTDRTPRF